MKKALLILFALISLAGCAKNEDNPNLLTGIGMPVFEGYPTLYETDDGYYALDYVDTIYSYEVIYEGAEGERYLTITSLDKNGAVLEETVLTEGPIASPIGVCDRGFYMQQGKTLYLADWSGTVTASAEILTNNSTVTVTSDGILIADKKDLTFYDSDLAFTAEYTLEVTPEQITANGDNIMIVYRQKEDGNSAAYLGKLEDGAISEPIRFPEHISSSASYSGYGDMMIACEDGWLYGFKGTMGVYRWKYGADEEEPVIEIVIDFTNSAIVSKFVTSVKKLPGEDRFIVTTSERDPYNGNHTDKTIHTLFEKAPDRDLSGMTVLTLACDSPSEATQKAVNLFNRDHDDVYVKILSYAEYGLSYTGEYGVGYYQNDAYDRMELDINSGAVKVDILLNRTVDPIDLYPYMTGEIRPKHLADCVKNAYEVNGQLKQIGAKFSLKTLTGKTEALGGMESWTMEEFLDYYDSLGDGEYIMDQLGQDNYSYYLFGYNAHAAFITDGQAHFDDGLYVRYLNFIASLPKEQIELMDYSKSALEQVIAGEITPEQADNMITVESDGSNLYYDNKIKLFNTQIQGNLSHLSHLRGVIDTMSYFGTEDVTFIGYPSDSESGTTATYSGDSYSIQSSCAHPELAWEFIESAILARSALPEYETLLFEFTTLTDVYEEYLESMRGYKVIKYLDSNKSAEGRDIEPNDSPSVVFEIDLDFIRIIVMDLFANAGSRDSVSTEIRKIAEEEESRFLAGVISAEECADIVQSRVSIYLAERS